MRLISFVALLLLFVNASAADSSINNMLPKPQTSMTYNAKVDTDLTQCVPRVTKEVLIQAQDGVNAADEGVTGQCPKDFVTVEGYNFQKIREINKPAGRNVLRAVSSKNGVVCCPLKNRWEKIA